MNCDEGPNGTCPRCGRRRRVPGSVTRCRVGLGDLVAAGLEATGIAAVAKAAATAIGLDDCGCEARRELLNQLGNLGNSTSLTNHPSSGSIRQ